TARSRSRIGGASCASLGVRKPGMSRSVMPRVRRICATRPGIPSGASPPTAPTDRGMIQRRCPTRLMTIKYPAWVCGAALLVVACTPQAVAPTPSPVATTSPSAAVSPGLPAAVDAQLSLAHRWYTVPDALIREDPVVTATFNGDRSRGGPALGPPWKVAVTTGSSRLSAPGTVYHRCARVSCASTAAASPGETAAETRTVA